MSLFGVGDTVWVKVMHDDLEDARGSFFDKYGVEPVTLMWTIERVHDPDDGEQMYDCFINDYPIENGWEFYEGELELTHQPVTNNELEATYASLGVIECLPLD